MKRFFFIPVLAAATVLASCGDDNKNNETPDVDVAFESVTADGASNTTTTTLTLTFDKKVEGLSAADITTESTVTKGALTDKGDGVYELALTKVSTEGEITVGVAKTGYKFTPASKKVTVFSGPLTEINYIGADAATAPAYFTSLTAGTAYVDFHANKFYTLGSNASASSCALIVNRQFAKSLNNYAVNFSITGQELATVTMSVGYMTDLTDLASYVKIKDLEYGGEGDYSISLSDAKDLPATTYFAIHYKADGAWLNNSFSKIIVAEPK